MIGLLFGGSRSWSTFPLIASVIVYILSNNQGTDKVTGQCVPMLAEAMVRNVALELEMDQNFEFLFPVSPKKDRPSGRVASNWRHTDVDVA